MREGREASMDAQHIHEHSNRMLIDEDRTLTLAKGECEQNYGPVMQ